MAEIVGMRPQYQLDRPSSRRILDATYSNAAAVVLSLRTAAELEGLIKSKQQPHLRLGMKRNDKMDI